MGLVIQIHSLSNTLKGAKARGETKMKKNEDTAAGIIDDDLAASILDDVNLHTVSIVESALQQGLELPFEVEHVTEGEVLYAVEVVRNEDKLRYLPSDEPWKF